MAISELWLASRVVRVTFCAKSKRTKRLLLTFKDSKQGKCSSPLSLSNALDDKFNARTCRVRFRGT